MKEKSVLKISLIMVIILTISVFIEVFVFNFRWLESIRYEEVQLTDFIVDKNLISKKDGSYIAPIDGKYNIEIKNIYQKIKNVKIKIHDTNTILKTFNITMYVTDSANKRYFKLPKITVVNNIERSQYHRLHLSGKTSKIKLKLDLDEDQQFKIDNISINAKVPLIISYYRILGMFGLFTFLYLIRPKSSLYKEIAIKSKYTKLVLVGFTLISSVLFYKLVNYNLVFVKPTSDNQCQYQRLTEAFAKGHLYIDEEPGETLKNMKNPYDTYYRNKLLLENDEEYLWDYSYFNGKYYVYFGALPVVSTYLPFYLLTGNHVRNNILNFILCTLIVISSSYLIYQIIKRWFPKTSLITYMLLCILFVGSSGVLYIAKRPDFYFIPIAYSIFLVTLGMGLWISSKKENKLSIPKICIGSFCMALVAGCRPQFLIASFFIFPLFFNYFFKNGKITKRKIIELLFLLVPYIIVAVPVMLYNYYRFNSIFDFGANYNLTTNDMTKRGFVFDRTFLGVYTYLFSPANYTSVFPYLLPKVVETTYMGTTIGESFFGGFIFNNIITILGLLAFKFKTIFKDKIVYNISWLAIIFVFIIIVVDTQMAGILPRYICDFSWLILLATIIVILGLNEKYGECQWFKKIFIVLLFLSLIYNINFLVTDVSFRIKYYNPQLFNKISYLVQFWL